MLRKVGLFDGYNPHINPDRLADLFKPDDRTKVEDDDEEEYEEEYEDEDGSNDEAGG